MEGMGGVEAMDEMNEMKWNQVKLSDMKWNEW
jgi:hypothetical protein